MAFGLPGQRPPWEAAAWSLGLLGSGWWVGRSESTLLFLSLCHTVGVLFPLPGLTAGVWVVLVRAPGLSRQCFLRMRPGGITLPTGEHGAQVRSLDVRLLRSPVHRKGVRNFGFCGKRQRLWSLLTLL